jgi:hypothetical protein
VSDVFSWSSGVLSGVLAASMLVASAPAAYGHGVHASVPAAGVYRYRMQERIVETRSDGSGRTFAVTALVTESVRTTAGDRELLRFVVVPSVITDGSRRLHVPPFTIRAAVTAGEITGFTVERFRASDAALVGAVPNLARILAYELRIRPRISGAHWRETELFRYAGLPIRVTLQLSGHPVARIQGSAPIPARTTTVNGYAVTIKGSLAEEGRLALGAPGTPPLSYAATAVVHLTARLMWMMVGREAVTVRVALTRTEGPPVSRRSKRGR